MLKKATTEVGWSEEEIKELIDLIKVENDDPGKMRDNNQYQLTYHNKTFSIDVEKVPEKYRKTFDSLKDNLEIVKRG